MPPMQAIWSRIEIWLATYAPDILRRLHQGATEEALRQTEALIHVELPEAVKASYRLHDGSDSDEAFIEHWGLFSLAGMVEEWKANSLYDGLPGAEEEVDPSDLLYFGFWHPKWIPMLHFSTGDLLCIDLAPGPAGQSGQIISFWHEDASANEVVATSWETYLAAFAEDLEAGKYRNDDGVLKPEDALTQRRRWGGGGKHRHLEERLLPGKNDLHTLPDAGILETDQEG